ncbi:major facilitator superfamily domain-containing protein [Xylariaceae sp. FL0804]|nr:major facilitator superfamily domain-containing protein [Xylariaceae sp. FL0804]
MSWKYAFSLSKAEVAVAEPPGTVRLIDEDESYQAPHTRARHDDSIQLVPRPSRSPRDPLNWPAWRKLGVLWTASLYGFVASFQASVLGSALPAMTQQLDPPRSLAQVTHLVAVNVLLIGVSNAVWVPLASALGKRPVALLALLVMTLASVWAGEAGDSFASLLAARAVQGLGAGPGDTIAPDLVGEVFFVHQRGRAMAVYTVFLAGGSFIGGIMGGYVAVDLGYRYLFWITTALGAFTFACQFLLVPETLFDRDAQLAREVGSRDSSRADVAAAEKEEEKVDPARVEERAVAAAPRDRFTFLESLKVGGVYRGRVLDKFLAPWRSLRLPGVWVVCLHYGGLLGGLATISTVGPAILARPPYGWGAGVGLFSVAGLIGGLLGGLLTYVAADRLVTRGARRSRNAATGSGSGLAEPERRLPAMFPALLLSVAGIWAFGFSAAAGAGDGRATTSQTRGAWVGMAFGFGMNAFGIVQIPSIGFNYLIEAYEAVSADCFVMTTITRAVVSFAWTYFVAEWVGRDGAAQPFGIFGMLMALFALLTIPLWLYGKRGRIATAGYLPREAHH